MLVLSARLMMLVNALTIESPVTTVYRMAPNAAAAIVPIAYSIIENYTARTRGRYTMADPTFRAALQKQGTRSPIPLAQKDGIHSYPAHTRCPACPGPRCSTPPRLHGWSSSPNPRSSRSRPRRKTTATLTRSRMKHPRPEDGPGGASFRMQTGNGGSSTNSRSSIATDV